MDEEPESATADMPEWERALRDQWRASIPNQTVEIRRTNLSEMLHAMDRQRALLRELVVDEGCPWREYENADTHEKYDGCALCGGRLITGAGQFGDPRRDATYDHTEPCLWPRLVREVKG